MSYSFNFDLTKVSRSFFKELANFTDEKELHKKISKLARTLVTKFKIDKMTGLPVNDAISLMEDLIEINVRNMSMRDEFETTTNRALLLPHCSRTHMDSECQATFNKELATYECVGCTEECLINKATEIGEEAGYDVYVFPGSSCITNLLQKYDYDGIVGVACSEEIKLGFDKLEKAGINYQGVPLLKNGCSSTKFNLKTLRDTL